MESETEQILTLIVSLDGDCISVVNCTVCPFASKCAATQVLWSKEKRIREAIDLLFNKVLFDE